MYLTKLAFPALKKNRNHSSQHIMRSVTVRQVVGGFAAAQIVGSGGVDREAQRLEAGAFVRAVTERLLAGTAAAAEEIGLAFLQLDLVWAGLRGDRVFSHGVSPNSAGDNGYRLRWRETRGGRSAVGRSAVGNRK